MNRKLLLIMLGILISACGSTDLANDRIQFTRVAPPVIFDDDNEASYTEKNTKVNTTVCNVLINSITDKRHSKNSFGTSYRYEKFAHHVPEWVETSLLSIKPHHLYLKQSEASKPEYQLQMNVEILRAYVHHRATALNANVVLRIKYTLNDKTQSKIYRGMDTSLNWAGGVHEVEDGMNSAISKVLDEITTDINKQCHKL